MKLWGNILSCLLDIMLHIVFQLLSSWRQSWPPFSIIKPPGTKRSATVQENCGVHQVHSNPLQVSIFKCSYLRWGRWGRDNLTLSTSGSQLTEPSVKAGVSTVNHWATSLASMKILWWGLVTLGRRCSEPADLWWTLGYTLWAGTRRGPSSTWWTTTTTARTWSGGISILTSKIVITVITVITTLELR